MVVVPVCAVLPILIAVAAEPIFTVVAVVLNSEAVSVVVVMSALVVPFTARSPPTTALPAIYKFLGRVAPEAPISYVLSVNVKFDITLLVNAKVVNLPVAAVVAPIDVLLIVDAPAGLIVTVPVPVGEIVVLTSAPLTVNSGVITDVAA